MATPTTSATAIARYIYWSVSATPRARHRRRVVVALRIGLIGEPPVDDVPGAIADVDGVIADALVEPGDDGELHRDLQIDVARGMTLEDHLDELAVEVVEVRVHVVQRRSTRGVANADRPRSPP